MGWSGADDAPATARIRALAPSMHAGERRVAEAIAADLATTVESTAQDLADAVGVGRATVVRTAQTLGYDGYPQLRVAAARELALAAPEDAPEDRSLLGTLRRSVSHFASRLDHTVSGLTEEALASVVAALDAAPRVLVVANGLSSPLGLDLHLRLTAAGRPAEFIHDSLAQRIAARQMTPADVCVVISGSGASDATLAVMRAADDSGAHVVAITSFARSAVAERADAALIVPPIGESFRDELLHTSRAALMLITEALVDAVVTHRGHRGVAARDAMLREVENAIRESER